MKVLEADGIVQVIESREVLAGLDLSLEQGEIPGLLGSKGSGKSTLLKILSGMQEPSADSSVYWEQFSAHPVLPYLARPNPAGQQIFVGLFTACPIWPGAVITLTVMFAVLLLLDAVVGNLLSLSPLLSALLPLIILLASCRPGGCFTGPS